MHYLENSVLCFETKKSAKWLLFWKYSQASSSPFFIACVDKINIKLLSYSEYKFYATLNSQSKVELKILNLV